MMSESAPPPPDAAALREAAVAHLARFATTRRGLEQMLDRRLRRWAERATRAGMESDATAETLAALQPVIGTILKEMAELGAVDDAAFARSRARGLTRTGRSRRAVTAHLMQKGVEAPVLAEALDDALGDRHGDAARDHEIGAALMLARKRRLGPFAPDAVDDAAREKTLGVFARNGFSRDVAEKVLAMDPTEAEEWVNALRTL